MDKAVWVLLRLISAGYAFYKAASAIITATVMVLQILEGKPWGDVLALGLIVLASTLVIFYIVLFFIREALVLLPEIKERWELAKQFDVMDRSGLQSLTLQEVVQRWTGDIPAAEETAMQKDIWTMKLRHLKAAVLLGLLPSDVATDADPNRNTRCTTKDLAKYFRSLKWIEVEKHRWPPTRLIS